MGGLVVVIAGAVVLGASVATVLLFPRRCENREYKVELFIVDINNYKTFVVFGKCQLLWPWCVASSCKLS